MAFQNLIFAHDQQNCEICRVLPLPGECSQEVLSRSMLTTFSGFIGLPDTSESLEELKAARKIIECVPTDRTSVAQLIKSVIGSLQNQFFGAQILSKLEQIIHDNGILLPDFLDFTVNGVDQDGCKIVGTLGSGTFANVLLVKSMNSQTMMAVKKPRTETEVYNKMIDEEKATLLKILSCDEETYNQINAKTKFDNPINYNIFCQYIKSVIQVQNEPLNKSPKHSGHIFMAVGYDLRKVIRLIPRQQFYEIISLMLRQIANGFEAIHNVLLVYCDLKYENLIVRLEFDEKIQNLTYQVNFIDFNNVSNRQNRENCNLCQYTSTGKGCEPYNSPEVHRSQEFSPTTDTWSFGVLMYLIFTGILPYIKERQNQINVSTFHEQQLEQMFCLPYFIPDQIRELISKYMVFDKILRPNIVDADFQFNLEGQPLPQQILSDIVTNTKLLSILKENTCPFAQFANYWWIQNKNDNIIKCLDDSALIRIEYPKFTGTISENELVYMFCEAYCCLKLIERFQLNTTQIQWIIVESCGVRHIMFDSVSDLKINTGAYKYKDALNQAFVFLQKPNKIKAKSVAAGEIEVIKTFFRSGNSFDEFLNPPFGKCSTIHNTVKVMWEGVEKKLFRK